jgi:hypothetical protein
LLTGFSVALGAYTYHSLAFLFFAYYPMLIAALWLGGQDGELRSRSMAALVSASMLLAALLAFPFLRELASGDALARFNMVSVPRQRLLLATLLNFMRHLDGRFLFLSGDANPRHHHGFLGELNILLLPFLLIGGWFCVKDEAVGRRDPFWIYILTLIAMAFIPASVTAEGIPHSLRSSAAVMPLFLLALYGLGRVQRIFPTSVAARAGVLVTLSLSAATAGYSVYYYFHQYRSLGGWDANERIERTLLHPAEVSTADHGMRSVYDRFARVARFGETQYCSKS